MNKEKAIDEILEKYKTVAVVGLSKDPEKDSFQVAKFLQSRGYHIIPVNPTADQILAQKSYRSLFEIPEDVKKTIEVVDVFRPSVDVPPIVDQAVELRKRYGKLYVVWLQLGIVNHEPAKKAEASGLTVIMDRCMRIERTRLDRERRRRT